MWVSVKMADPFPDRFQDIHNGYRSHVWSYQEKCVNCGKNRDYNWELCRGCWERIQKEREAHMIRIEANQRKRDREGNLIRRD